MRYRKEYLRWIFRSRNCKQALLDESEAEPAPNTPEHFYRHEMLYRSTLYERAKVRNLTKETRT